MWQISKMPCRHALTIIRIKGDKAKNYLSQWYSKTKYLKAYEVIIYPISDMSEWIKTDTPQPDPLPWHSIAR